VKIYQVSSEAMEQMNIVRINNLMKMSENIVGDYDQTLKLCKDRKITYRLNVIEWIKRVSYSLKC
jgi:hypothetical protein